LRNIFLSTSNRQSELTRVKIKFSLVQCLFIKLCASHGSFFVVMTQNCLPSLNSYESVRFRILVISKITMVLINSL